MRADVTDESGTEVVTHACVTEGMTADPHSVGQH